MIKSKLEKHECWQYWYECKCGYDKLSQNDNYCSGCGSKIESEEWEKAIRMKVIDNPNNGW